MFRNVAYRWNVMCDIALNISIKLHKADSPLILNGGNIWNILLFLFFLQLFY